MNDLVSIICPSYNCGRFVSKTIESVLNQTYNNWELLIADDYSNDNTLAIVNAYMKLDSRVRYICNGSNLGAAVTRNNAIKRAKGRWIAFLDSDDLWSPTKLEKQVLFMEENGYAFSYTCYEEMDSEGISTGVSIGGPSKITKLGMSAFCWPGCLTVMYDATKVGLIQIEDIKKNNDYAMWLRIIKKADCYLLNESLATYRRGRTGSVSSHGIITMIGWHFKLWHDAEHKNMVSAFLHTVVNLVCGLYKKVRYVKKTN